MFNVPRWRLTARMVAALCVLLSTACALPVKQIPIDPITPVSGKSFTLAVDARCSLNTGYHRSLYAGTRWVLFGTISRGEVYRSSDQTVTVEGYNVHEAYPVVDAKQLVGFYLPVERTFTPLANPVSLFETN
jgi:hypothetical protein